MGLIAWYPLNGDLKDRGLLGYDLTNSNSSVITVNNSGKIGKCYEDLTTSYAYLEASNPIKLPQTHSMFCWVYPEVLTSDASLDGVLGNHIFTDSNPSNTGITLKYISSTTYKVSLNTANTSNQRTFGTYVGNTILNINEWHHIGFTYDGKKIRLYVDGKLDGEYSYTNMKMTSQKIRIFSWSNAYASKDYTGKKKINDVRIYDHCLSQTEIKQISQACILHYNFEDVVVPYQNEGYEKKFWIYNNPVGGVNATASLTTLSETFEGQPIYRLKMSTDNENVLTTLKNNLGGHGVTLSGAITFEPNIPISFGILYRNISHPDNIVGGTAANKFNRAEISSKYYKSGWYRVGQYRLNETDTAGTDNFYTSFKCPSLQLNEEIIIDFCCPEVYKGINFLPERQTYEKNADLTIYDSSGYGHNGILDSTNLPIFKESDVEGSYSLLCQYKSTSVAIKTNQIFFDNVNQCHTVSFWVKPLTYTNTTDNHYLVNFNSAYFTKFGSGNKTLCYINSGSNDHYVYGSTLPQEEWTFVTWVYDHNNEILKVYYNGELDASTYFSNISQKTPYGFQSQTYFGKLDGYIDDIRIYATALSAEDIKQLYKSRAKVDKDGKILTNQFNEKTIFDKDNLIYNGMLELKNTDGFLSNNISYDSNDCFRGSNGCLVVKGTFGTQGLIPICSTDTYKFEVDLKFVSITNNKYLSLIAFDQHKGEITFSAVNRRNNTDTTLAQEVNNGDTQIQVTSTANWCTDTSDASKYQRLIGICDYPEYGYERARSDGVEYSSISENTINLKSAWGNGSFPAGTKITNSYAGYTFFYFTRPETGEYAFTPADAPKEWTHYEFTVKGNAIRKFTNYIRFSIVNSGGEYRITNMRLTNITSPQTITNVYGKNIQNIDKNYMLYSNEFNESTMPVRYIRDTCGGSDVNNYAHWVEIEAFNITGQNLALGKQVTDFSGTSSVKQRVTDGNKNTNIYLGTDNLGSDGVGYVTIDLGFIEDIEKIVVYHYYSGGRTYKSTKTEVSTDGVNWYTVFDSAIEGTYQENSSGHTIYLTPQKCTINKSGKTYTNKLIES